MHIFIICSYPQIPHIFFSIWQEAEKSIQFYKNIRKSHENRDKILEQEITKLRTIIAGNGEAVSGDNTSVKWSDFTTKTARKAIVIGTVLVGMYVWSGASVLTAYVAKIFQETGSTLSPNVSAIGIGIVQVLGTCVAASTCDRFGRKVLITRNVLRKISVRIKKKTNYSNVLF